MSVDATREEKRVKKDTRKAIAWTLAGIAAAVVVVFGVLLFRHIDDLLGQVAQGQARHAATLNSIAQVSGQTAIVSAHIDALTTDIAKEQATASAGSATVSQILVEAGQAVQVIETQEAEILSLVRQLVPASG